ncbi:response regulator [Alteromonas lipolytica]|uniref:Sensory/regulatory protein RpfC n=1 Tax=Alteromonas lipolytica TaxID=1856405 RepID=A0A1E8FD78_9ALTE|nr:response regulator [Alteromonas lipolytica]OFI33538.1 hypothetical protein BFC17_04580 [Alteromonas lipolytica]GGF58825.1 hypothetical protein GCM10011338_08840 [Alteromonas lipolytica]
MQIAPRNSLEVKSVVALLLLLALVGFLLYTIENDIEALFEEVNSAEEIARTNVNVLDLNKTVESMQRNVSVYGVSGSKAIFDKLTNNNQLIQRRLLELTEQTDDEQMKSIIDDLFSLTIRYKENLTVLPKRYQIKSDFANKILPAAYQSFDLTLTSALERTNGSGDRALLLESMALWAKANHAASLFLSNKEYSQRRNVVTYIAAMEGISAQLSAAFLQQNPEWPEMVIQATTNYQNNFEKATQANRNYAALVNVVMAGDAVEFTTLVDKLTDYTSTKFNRMQQNITELSNENNKLLGNSLIAAAVLCILFALVFHFYITRAIKSLANTFQQFIQGDFSASVAGGQRPDEIGLLAQAAIKFRDLSQRLIDAKTDAENTSRIKSEFLANMSHEIRTPMNGILGMAQTLSHSELTPQQREMLGVINSSGKSLLAILNDILDLSKLEAHKVELESAPFTLDEICFELQNMFASVAEQKGITLKLPARGSLQATVLSDQLRLKQVMINLLSNAIKFTEKGTVSVIISEQARSEQSITYTITIRDTGIGIPSTAIDSLTEAFTQADTSITRSFGGTGLGLAITSNILNLFNTQLEISSRLGEGAAFYFTLRLPLAPVIESAAEHPVLQTVDELIPDRQLKVLIVDDSQINQMVIESLLATLKQQSVTCVMDGREALNALQSSAFDIVFMDMQMPVMDGISATKAIREDDRLNRQYIIGLSANVMLEDRQKCLDAGMNDFLGKPLLREELSAALNRYIEFTSA